MPVRIDKKRADEILKEEAKKEKEGFDVPPKWEQLITEFSVACDDSSKTHIAFLGTALLAKATNINVDPFSVKASDSSEGAYSARGLGHGVLVPNAPLLDIHLGVTGREPLNNQPYFRIKRATTEILLPLIRGHAEGVVRLLVDMLEHISHFDTPETARDALRAFIRVRRRYKPEYKTSFGTTSVLSIDRFIISVEKFVLDNAEGGKRAQAIAAGLMDLFSGDEQRVESGRINDPDRHLAGDVGVFALMNDGQYIWERVFEVRDKPVSEEDIVLFAQKCAIDGIERAAVLAVSQNQKPLDLKQAIKWSKEKGISLTVFTEWRPFIEQVFFWCHKRMDESLNIAYRRIRARLIEVEVSPQAIELWDDLLAD